MLNFLLFSKTSFTKFKSHKLPQKILRTRFRHVSACFQTCLIRVNYFFFKVLGLSNSLKGAELMFLFSYGLSLTISTLPLLSNKDFLFSWAKILKLSKKGKELHWSKWSQTALLFDGLTIFPIKDGISISSPDILSKCLILSL